MSLIGPDCGQRREIPTKAPPKSNCILSFLYGPVTFHLLRLNLAHSTANKDWIWSIPFPPIPGGTQHGGDQAIADVESYTFFAIPKVVTSKKTMMISRFTKSWTDLSRMIQVALAILRDSDPYGGETGVLSPLDYERVRWESNFKTSYWIMTESEYISDWE
jgi:hypothetical protein